MSTPEGRIKKHGRAVCNKLGIFYFPVNQGAFGVNGIPDDCLCVGGQFVFIEYKHRMLWNTTKTGIKSRPTLKQVAVMDKARQSGAYTLVVDDDNLIDLEGDLTLIQFRIKEHPTLFCGFDWVPSQYQAYNEGRVWLKYRFDRDKCPVFGGYNE